MKHDFFNSRKWTPKEGNVCREKRRNRTSASTLLKVALKRRRQRAIDLMRSKIRALKEQNREG